MPLQTAEALITADFGPDDFISLPLLNSLSPTGARTRQAIPTFTVLDIAEKATKAGGELCHEHKQLISGLNGQYLYDRARCTKEDLIDLTGKVRLTLIYLIIFIHLFFDKFQVPLHCFELYRAC